MYLDNIQAFCSVCCQSIKEPFFFIANFAVMKSAFIRCNPSKDLSIHSSRHEVELGVEPTISDLDLLDAR